MADFLDEVTRIRSRAARFYSADFHAHSPCSYDWKNDGSEEYAKRPELDYVPPGGLVVDHAVRAYRELCVTSKREVVFVTDHNRYSFAEKAAGLHNGLLVIPGIELSIKIRQPLLQDYRLHVLAVFPPGTGSGEVDRIFPDKSPDEMGRNGREEFEYDTIGELLDKVQKAGGLTIAAHIDSDRGFRATYVRSTDLVLEPFDDKDKAEFASRLGGQIKTELYKFNCLQVRSTTCPVHYFDDEGNLKVPLVLGSDCHEARLLVNEVSERLTYVKMGDLSYSSMVEALKFPDTRIRFKADQEPHPRILGLRIYSAKVNENSFFKELVLGFSDNLTCIIGPRGSGKSACIDAIRYLMGYNRSLDEIRKLKDQVIDRQSHTLHETRIELLYQCSDDTVYRLESIYDPKTMYNTKVFDADGNVLQIEDVEICGDFPLNLYGWNELEVLAENTQTQREMLDRFIPDITGIRDGIAEFIGRLEANRKECIAQAEMLELYFSDPENDFLRLHEYESLFSTLNSEKIEKIFRELDIVEKKQSLLKHVRNQYTTLKPNEVPALNLNAFVDQGETEYIEWANEFIKDRLKAPEYEDWAAKCNVAAEITIKAAISIIDSEMDCVNVDYNRVQKEIRDEIGEDEVITGDLRNAAKARKDKATANYASYQNELKKLHDLVVIRKNLIDEIVKLQKELFATRSQEIENIVKEISIVEDEDFTITLRLKQLGDKSSFLQALNEGGTKPEYHGQWIKSKIPEAIVSALTPVQYAAAIFNGQHEKFVIKVEDESESVYSINEQYAETFVNNNCPREFVEEYDVEQFDVSRLDKILRMQEVAIDDEFCIELGGKPIQYCSPGQRCSAMLPIVTLTSNAPVIIDQPEDNLDNRLVSKALFKILTKLKETRQIILATHNPNILVSGDAEQVLVLSNVGELEDYGSIDKESIVQTVINLLEGGREAFKKREIRYRRFIHD